MAKASVSTLQEFCAKQKLPSPIYDYLDGTTDGAFYCRVELRLKNLMELEAEGSGRSKRDAKHHAAANLIKKLRMIAPEISEMGDTVMHDDEVPTTDMIVTLRDYCLQHQHPLPNIEIIQQSGSPNAPEFTAVCQVATIRRFGMSEKKKDAKQKAAFEMLRVIMTEDSLEGQMEVATLETKTEIVEADRYQKFKTYRELTESSTGEVAGVLLCDRHNFFTKFYDELKQNAAEVLKNHYESDQEKALDILEALKIKPKIKQVPSQSADPIVLIDLDIEYDIVFAGFKSKIYHDVVSYFRDMLY